MTRYAALLRGVNIGPNKRVPMADFRDLLTGLGYDDVSTYVQSGNAVFTSGGRNGRKLAREIEDAIESRLHLDVPVVVLSKAELAKIVRDNPFPGAAADPKTLHVTFFDSPVDELALARLDLGSYVPDELAATTREIYLSLPNGLGRSKLVVAVERVTKGAGTSRNWRTVTALLDLMG